MADGGAAPNAYEEARLKRIADNRQKLAALGLAHGAAALGGAASGPIAGALRAGSLRAARADAGWRHGSAATWFCGGSCAVEAGTAASFRGPAPLSTLN